jgi:hypothetical protein
MQVLHEQLPPSVCAPTTKKKYLDLICEHFGLKLARVGGNGNCFFVACAKVLSCLGITVDASVLRQQVVAFLRECYFHQLHGVLGERCCMEMEHEVDARIPLVSSTALHNGFVPESMESYLTATADISVWACGYHWIRAVASLHAVSIVLVIHSFEYVQLFSGDSTHPRVFLYKTDVETHYDALVPNTNGLSQTNEASSPPPNHSLSSPPAPCAPLSAEDLRAARVKALNLSRSRSEQLLQEALNLQQSTSAAALTDQDELGDSVAASSLLSLLSYSIVLKKKLLWLAARAKFLRVATIALPAGQKMKPMRRMSQLSVMQVAVLGTASKLSKKLATVLRSTFHLGGVCQNLTD